MNRNRWMPVLLVCGALNCSPSMQSGLAPQSELQCFQPSELEHGVLSALFPDTSEFDILGEGLDSPHAEWAVIKQWISVDKKLGPDSLQLKALVDEFDQATRSHFRFCQRTIPGDVPVHVMPDSELNAYFRDGADWERFYERYPRSFGIQSLSPIAFSPDSSFAMVYHTRVCGNLCGSATYLIFKSHAGRWRQWAFVPCWVS